MSERTIIPCFIPS